MTRHLQMLPPNMQSHAALIIEDDDAIRTLVCRLLVKTGFDPVHAVSDGDAGLAHLRENAYCVVVLDLHMPRLSGFDLIAAVRREGLTTSPFVVVLTADAKVASGSPQIILDPSVVAAVIRKPFDLESFIDTVNACLEDEPLDESRSA